MENKTSGNIYDDFYGNGSLIIFGCEWKIRFEKLIKRGIFWRITMDERLEEVKGAIRDFSISPESFPKGLYYQGFVPRYNLSFGCVKKDNNLFFTIAVFDNQKYRLYFRIDEIKELLKI